MATEFAASMAPQSANTDKTVDEIRQERVERPNGPPVEEVLFNYLRDVIKNPTSAVLDLQKLPENFQKLGQGLQYVVKCLAETTTLAKSLSQGDLDGPWPSKGNDMASALKGLHATLKHLTWQTQQIAKGDYNHRVSFMGDFSTAFNSMVEQLDERREALLNEIEASRQKTVALIRNNEFFEKVTGQMSQWIVVIERDSRDWVYTNHDVGEILADKRMERQLKLWMRNLCDMDPSELGKNATEFDLENRSARQSFSVTSHPINWHGREAIAFVFTDISSAKERLQKLEDIAYRDPLTKTYNRHFGMEILGEWLSERDAFAICFVDMDNLKYVNDKYGHAEGDNYILRVSELLRDFSSDVIVCRLGGDEFMLLAREWDELSAEAHMERLRECLLEYNDKPEAFYINSISYGVVGVDAFNERPASELLAIADEKMYEYKKAHKMQRQSTLG
jgi:diguanylate cyclase (GGDEF)-like protein